MFKNLFGDIIDDLVPGLSNRFGAIRDRMIYSSIRKGISTKQGPRDLMDCSGDRFEMPLEKVRKTAQKEVGIPARETNLESTLAKDAEKVPGILAVDNGDLEQSVESFGIGSIGSVGDVGNTGKVGKVGEVGEIDDMGKYISFNIDDMD